jgi:hypothetical protein
MTCNEFVRAIDAYLDDELSVLDILRGHAHLLSLENPASEDISWPRLSCVKYLVRRTPVSGDLWNAKRKPDEDDRPQRTGARRTAPAWIWPWTVRGRTRYSPGR